jgi:hypothetical protein
LHEGDFRSGIAGSPAAKPNCYFFAANHDIALAIINAAPAAALPISAVCKALRVGRVPVNRPLMNPKMNNAANVVAIEMNNAVCGLGVRM